MPSASGWAAEPTDDHEFDDAAYDEGPVRVDGWSSREPRSANLHDTAYATWAAPDEIDEDGSHRTRPRPPSMRPARRGQQAARPPAFEGLTATGAGVVGLVGVGVGAVIDAALSPGVGLFFALVFVLTSAFIGLRLRGHDAWAALAAPPLLFIAGAGIAAQVGASTQGGWVQKTSAEMATAVIGQPVVLFLGTAIAVGAVLYRAAVERSSSARG